MKKKGNKKTEITCYKCAKSRHYSNQCDEVTTVKTSTTNSTGKQGSNFLVPKKDEEYSSSEDKNLRMYLRLTKKKMKKLKEMTKMTKKNT